MLKKFRVRNFKNFKEDIEFDFGRVGGYKFNEDCLIDKTIGKATVYGKNATGKTNFGLAVFDIFSIINETKQSYGTRILNAGSQEDKASFLYEFLFDEDQVVYEYSRRSDSKIADERLSINEKVIFEIEYDNSVFNFNSLSSVEAETIQTNKYIETKRNSFLDESASDIPFIRYLLNNTALSKNSALYKLENYVRRMRMFSVNSQIYDYGDTKTFLKYLENSINLKSFEGFLNEMGIECNLKLDVLPDGSPELYFNYPQALPFFDNISSGTRSLVYFYIRYLAFGVMPSFIYMDEFDAFYHYEMAEKLVRYFKEKFTGCQIVITTHNTNLMVNQLMRPDCLFILSADGRLTALADATERELREGHNLEKLYISGEFSDYE